MTLQERLRVYAGEVLADSDLCKLTTDSADRIDELERDNKLLLSEREQMIADAGRLLEIREREWKRTVTLEQQLESKQAEIERLLK